MKTEVAKELPSYFKPVLWSFDFDKVDPQKNKKEIIVNALNYGDLIHWSWILHSYGGGEIREAIAGTRQGAIRPGAMRLSKIIFG